VRAGTRDTDVTVTFGPNTATSAPPESDRGLCPTPKPVTKYGIQPGASANFLQRGGDDWRFEGCTYIGSAMITSSGSALVAVVNQVTGGGGSASEAVPADLLSGTARLPLIQVNNFGSSGGLQVANFGPDQVTATITFDRNTDTGTPPDRVAPCPGPPDPIPGVTLGPLGTKTLLLPSQTPKAQGCTYIGSVTVESSSPGARLATLANQVNEEGLDPLATYAAS
jgi:hypothetical protein